MSPCCPRAGRREIGAFRPRQQIRQHAQRSLRPAQKPQLHLTEMSDAGTSCLQIIFPRAPITQGLNKNPTQRCLKSGLFLEHLEVMTQ